MPKPLIAYYSRRGQNYVGGRVEGTEAEPSKFATKRKVF